MSEPFLGEIRMFAGNFAPRGWALCNGQILAIAQNSALFAILGVTYGGNGSTNFALPNLQSRVPLHPGQGQGLSPYVLGQASGEESVTLTANQMPPHAHMFQAPVGGDSATEDPTNAYLANSGNSQYTTEPTAGAFAGGGMTSTAGSGGAHDNLQPYLCVNFIIALQGTFPSRN